MGMRSDVAEVISALISFGAIARSTAYGTAFIVAHEDDNDGDECEIYGSPGVQTRAPAGSEHIFVDLDGERVIFGMRETRWQIALQVGETVLRALADGAAYLKMKPDGTAEFGKHGAPAPTSPLSLDDLVQAQFEALKTAIAGAPITPTDGGAAFKAGLLSALSAWPAPTASTVVRSL